MLKVRHTESLTEARMMPYAFKITVVRLFKKNWYVGCLRPATFDNGTCFLRICPYARFIPGNNIDPKDPGEQLLTVNDEPIAHSRQDEAQPFKLANSRILVLEDQIENTLSIEFSGGAVIFSNRLIDIDFVERFLSKSS